MRTKATAAAIKRRKVLYWQLRKAIEPNGVFNPEDQPPGMWPHAPIDYNFIMTVWPG